MRTSGGKAAAIQKIVCRILTGRLGGASAVGCCHLAASLSST